MVGIEPFPPSVAARRPDLLALGCARDPGDRAGPHRGHDDRRGVERQHRRGHLQHTEDLTIAPPQLRSAKTVTAADDRVLDVWEDLRYDQAGVRCFPSHRADAGRRVPARLRRDPGRRGAAVVPRCAGRRHRRRPAHPTAGLGGLERRGLDHRARLPGFHRRAEPRRADRVARPDRARAADGRQRSRVLAARAPARPRCRASRRTRPRRGSARSTVQAFGGTVGGRARRDAAGGETIGRSDGSAGAVVPPSRVPPCCRAAKASSCRSPTPTARPTGPRSRTSPVPVHATSTTSGTAPPASSVSARMCATRMAVMRQHGLIPRDGAFISVTATGTAAVRAATSAPAR